MRVTIGISQSNQTNTIGYSIEKFTIEIERQIVGELIDDFNGSENTFEKWKRQIELVIAMYKLDNNAAKILISTKLKGKALR